MHTTFDFTHAHTCAINRHCDTGSAETNPDLDSDPDTGHREFANA